MITNKPPQLELIETTVLTLGKLEATTYHTDGSRTIRTLPKEYILDPVLKAELDDLLRRAQVARYGYQLAAAKRGLLLNEQGTPVS